MVWVYIIAAVVIFLLLKELIRLPTIGKYGERYVFITGCDTGFGNALAKRLDSLGFNVFAACYTERAADELRKVSSARLKTVSLDVTKTESISKARETVEKQLPANKGLWAIVNNAGVAANLAPSELLTRVDYDVCLSVNLFGYIEVTKSFQALVRKEKGRIVNMASVAGRMAVAVTPYAISKYGVEAFSDCLRREVLKQGITVHIIEPSFFKTEIGNMCFDRQMERCYNEASKEVQLYYGKKYLEKVKTDFLTAAEKSMCTKLDLVVDAYTHAITAMFPRPRYLVGPDWYIWKLVWNLPEWIVDRLLCHNLPVPDEMDLHYCSKQYPRSRSGPDQHDYESLLTTVVARRLVCKRALYGPFANQASFYDSHKPMRFYSRGFRTRPDRDRRNFVLNIKTDFLTAAEKSMCTKLDLVVDAYTHAITAMFPRPRYLVGPDWYIWKLVWNLPEWIVDRLLCHNLPVPDGAK